MNSASHLHVRIDNRLLHGQVVQFWIPYLQVSQLLIVDDLVASNPAISSVYQMALPRHIRLSVLPVSRLVDQLPELSKETTLILMSDIFDLARARMSGFDCHTVTLGNIHSAPGRQRVTDAVYLTREELEALSTLLSEGKRIEIRTFPGTALQMEWTPERGCRWIKS